MRGYPLKGTEVSLSENLQGLILRESERLQIDGTERELKFGGKFSKFIYWNYDKNPSQNDCYQKALHWIKCSEAVGLLIKLQSPRFHNLFHVLATYRD